MSREVWESRVLGHLQMTGLEPMNYVVGEPVDRALVQKYIGQLGEVGFPEDLVDFYTNVNGFGVRTRDGVFYTVVPVEQLEKFVKDVREMYSLHEKDLEDFFPFVLIGADPIGVWGGRGLYVLDTNEYYWDSEQDCDEFMFQWQAWRTLADFLAY